MLQPQGLILGQVPLVKALVNGQGLAQLGGATAELTVLEGAAGGTFPDSATKLPHGLKAPQGLQCSQQDARSVPWLETFMQKYMP